MTPLFRCVIGSQLYGAATPTSDTDFLTVGWDDGEGVWSPERFLARAAGGYPSAVQALFAPAPFIQVGEPLVAFRPFLVGPPMLAGLADFLDANRRVARTHTDWSRPLWQAVVIATMRRALQDGPLILPFPNAAILRDLRGHVSTAWDYLASLEGA